MRNNLRILRVLAACGAVALCGGCRLGGTSFNVNSDTNTPRVGVTMVPKQWEPKPAESESDVRQTGEDETETPESKPKSRWWRGAKLPRIPLPRTDGGGEAEDEEEEEEEDGNRD